MLHCQRDFHSHFGAVGIEFSDLLEGDRLIIDVCVQIGNERRAFPAKCALSVSSALPGFHPGRQVSHCLRVAVSRGLDADLGGRLLDGHRHRTDGGTLCRGLAARQIHRPGSGEVGRALRGKARCDERCDAQRPKETFHAGRICNWGATVKSWRRLEIEALRSGHCSKIRHCGSAGGGLAPK